MSQYTEEEQIETLKHFWDDYGNALLTLLLLVAIAFAGWRFWQRHQNQLAVEAATRYQHVLMDAQAAQQAQGDQAKAANTLFQSDAAQLLRARPDSGYAALTRLLLARAAIDHGDLQEADHQLTQLLAHRPEAMLAAVARLRLAQVKLAEHQVQDALAMLQQVKDPAFAASVAELRGDAYVQMNQAPQARQAYLQAKERLQATHQPARPLLDMKMADLGVAPAPADAGAIAQ